MRVKSFKGFWTINDVRNTPSYLFIYGDNDMEYGKGGQAVIRDEPNAIGIPTKKVPNNNVGSFYSDVEYDLNAIKIDKAISKIIKKLKTNKYDGIILPKSGLGTGLSNLKNCAPLTFVYLNESIEKLKSDVNIL